MAAYNHYPLRKYHGLVIKIKLIKFFNYNDLKSTMLKFMKNYFYVVMCYEADTYERNTD